MLLGDYFDNLKKDYKKIFFSNISFNSSKIKKNNIFFAINGSKIDGNKFIKTAIKKGSKIIITEKEATGIRKGILFLKSKNVRKLLAETSYKIHKNIPKRIIAVTGTNGKSSIVDFYYQILDLNNKKVAAIGTLGVRSKYFKKSLANTTINPIELGKILTDLKKQKIDNVIMEASSHGLKQNRLDGLEFDAGIFTNLSQDHLDYHKNLNDYLRAKLYLFEKLLKKDGNIISDNKIPEFKKLKKISIKKNFKIYSIHDDKKNFELLSHEFKGETQILEIRYKNRPHKFELNLIGKIQLKNILMAIIAAQKSNIKIENVFKVIHKIKPVEGRLQRIGNIKNKSRVILDYAHTPDALKICLKNLKEQFPNKKILIVFGCGGNRDHNKRAKMGEIADLFSNKIYLTDDNPRYEDPNKIRKDIKKGIKKKNICEISDRKRAIRTAINDLNVGEILLVAGKGHEKIQDFGIKKTFFSDKKIILESINYKNSSLSENLKVNIIKELSKKKLPENLIIKKGCINSKEIKKNDIFFAVKGKKNDGNKYVGDAINKKASLTIVSKINKKYNIQNQIKIKKPLQFLTDCSKIFRENIDTKIIAITGSCGKTTLKELLVSSLKKLFKVSFSPKSFNNKFGVPLSLFNLNELDNFGILEVGMDKIGEIDNLSKIIQPNLAVITNVNYAHIKNFKNIKQIASAKAEIINNIKDHGFLVLNADDYFFNFHKKIALKKNLKIFSFGIKNKNSFTKLINIHKVKKNIFRANIRINNISMYFFLPNDFESNILNFLAAITVMNTFFDISKINKNIFLNFIPPNGRGDISKIKIDQKNIFLVDESYNSNPLSLRSAIINYDKLISKNSKKYLILGDMLELGSHSKKLHESIGDIINKTNIDKTFVFGDKITLTFDKILKKKKGKILDNKLEIINLIKSDLNNNDYLMVKASNATGLNMIINNLKNKGLE